MSSKLPLVQFVPLIFMQRLLKPKTVYAKAFASALQDLSRYPENFSSRHELFMIHNRLPPLDFQICNYNYKMNLMGLNYDKSALN